MLDTILKVTRVLDYETDDDAHFECPQCGQKGSVPKATIEKALAKTPHVYISCSNCAHKFEPFAPIEEAEASAGGEAEAPTEPETDTVTGTAPSPLEEHWAQHDDEDDADSDAAEGHLPGWMMPVEKPQAETKNETTGETNNGALPQPEDAPQEDVPQGGPQQDGESDALTASETQNEATLDEALDEALDEVIAEEMAANAAPDDTTDEVADDIGEDVLADAVDETAGKAVSDAVLEDSEDSDKVEVEVDVDVEAEPTLTEESQPATEPDLPEADDEPQYATQAALTIPPAKGPTGLLNRLLVGLVLILLATGAYMFLGSQSGAPSDLTRADSSAVILQKAGFVRFTEDGEAGIEVSISFNNPSAQIGIIGDFRIELQNQARERLVHWTILSTGETVAPGRSRTLTSVLFGPPAGLAHVNIVYPLDD